MDIQTAYRELFATPNPALEIVIEDLKQFCLCGVNAFSPTSETVTAHNLGKQAVLQYIESNLEKRL